jgi:multidrug efflux pump subunit AcrA (membrane-fusion protein)
VKPVFPILGIISMVLVLSGCSRKETPGSHEPGEHDGHATQGGVTFNSKQGLSVPSSTAKFIGLQVADVEGRNIAMSVRFTARVFQGMSERKFVSAVPAMTSFALASAFISPVQAALLTNGQPAVVSLDGVGSLKGRVTDVNRSLEKVQGQAEAMVVIDDPSARLTNGVTVSVSVPLGREQSVVVIPRSALLRTAEGDFVYTVSGTRFVRAALKTGEVSNEFVEVTDGLYAGDRIVVQPVMTLWLAELQSIRGGKACADGH